uniref:Uncharacterized protein n=1 Tax=Oreochromis aureus TaxID=47969 RepID=A0A668SVR7_OREAU
YRVLWISCMLIGSIVCVPVEYVASNKFWVLPCFSSDYGFDMEYEDTGTYPMQEGAFFYDHSQESANYEADDGYDHIATGSSAGPRSSRSNEMVGDDWFTSGYTGGNSAYADTSGEENKPVFSDVSGLEPVYTTGSRSRYQRGRSVFAQTRYTPTESVGFPMPLFPATAKKWRA